MRYGKLQDKLFEIKAQIAELDAQRVELKDFFTLTKRSIGEQGYFTARWKEDPDLGLTYRIDFFTPSNSLMFEGFGGSGYKRLKMTPDVESRCVEIHSLFQQWLADEIDWPFPDDDYPRL